MSRYAVVVTSHKYGRPWISEIDCGWDPVNRQFFLHTDAYDWEDAGTWFVAREPTVNDLVERVKSRNRLQGITGLGFVGRMLRALQPNLEHDQKDNVPSDLIIEGTATEIPNLKELMQ